MSKKKEEVDWSYIDEYSKDDEQREIEESFDSPGDGGWLGSNPALELSGYGHVLA